MRYFPAALALSLLAGVTASVGVAESEVTNPRVAALLAEGRAKMDAGQLQDAIGAFEAALAIAPGQSAIYLALAEAERQVGMQGKAIHYYREALEREPGSFTAIAGEGEALVEKGAVEKARLNLAKLQSMCGEGCAETQALAAAIAAGPPPQVAAAEAVPAEPAVTQN